MNGTATTGATLIGWQTLLADLSLILFMVTAASMPASRTRATPVPMLTRKPPWNPALGEPLAVWRAGGSQTLAQWLAAQQPDDRQQLTITARYRPGAETTASAAAQALVVQAGTMGKVARVIIAPAAAGAGDELLAGLAYDQAPDAGPAQGLRADADKPFTGTPP